MTTAAAAADAPAAGEYITGAGRKGDCWHWWLPAAAAAAAIKARLRAFGCCSVIKPLGEVAAMAEVP